MKFTSPRTTAPNHSDERSPISTSPITTALSTAKVESWSFGALPPNGRIVAMSGSPRSGADASPRSPEPQGYGGAGRAQGAAPGVGDPVEDVGGAVRHERLVNLVRRAPQARAQDGERDRPDPPGAARPQRQEEERAERAVLDGVE